MHFFLPKNIYLVLAVSLPHLGQSPIFRPPANISVIPVLMCRHSGGAGGAGGFLLISGGAGFGCLCPIFLTPSKLACSGAAIE